MPVGLLTVIVDLPGCRSLKEKRSRVRPILARAQRTFNVSAAEVDHLDAWGEAVLAFAMVSNEAAFTHSALTQVLAFLEEHYPDTPIQQHRIEVL